MALTVADARLRLGAAFQKVLMLQGGVVLAMALFAAFRLFPGALSRSLRDQVMRASAYGYEEAVWLDGVLPEDAVVLTSARSRALIPRPFVVDERPWLPLSPGGDDVPCRAPGNVTALVLSSARERDFGKTVSMRHEIAGPRVFSRATRNPWNATGEESVVVLAAAEACP
jgi:hypothetical protein